MKNPSWLPSRQQVTLVFLAIIFPISFWSIIFFSRELPSYLMRMKSWDILGVLAYTLTITLIDSLLLIVWIIIISVLIPHRFFRDRFAAQGILTSYLIIIWTIGYHYVSSADSFTALIQEPRLFWSLWVGSLLIAAIFLNFLAIRMPIIQQALLKFVDRLSVLSVIYIALIIISLVIVILRNLGIR